MKIIVLSFLVLGAFAIAADGDSYRRTTEDMYQESFANEWGEHMVAKSPQQIRVEQYRRLTEICDEHHNCKPYRGEIKPFINVPLWR